MINVSHKNRYPDDEDGWKPCGPKVDPLPRTLRLGPLGNPIPLTLRGPEWDPFKRPTCKPIWTVRLRPHEGGLYPLRGFSGVGDKFWPHTLRDPEIDIGLMRRNCPYCNNKPCVCPGYPDSPDPYPGRLTLDPVPDPCPSCPGGK